MPPLNIDALIATVDKSVGVQASATTLIHGFAATMTAAVVAALEADDAADQGSIDAATAAIAAEEAKLNSASDALAAAIVARQTPTA